MFIFNEQYINMNIMDIITKNNNKNIMQEAIEAFKRAFPFEIKIDLPDQPASGFNKKTERLLKIKIADKDFIYLAEIMPFFTKGNKLPLLMRKENLPHPLLLVTKHVNVEMADILAKEGIAFIDTAGNAFINKPPLFIFVKGNKLREAARRVPIGRVFRPAGLKMLYAMLCNPGLEKRTVREIAAAAEVAIGTVDWVLKELKALGFLLDMGKQGYKLVQKEKLFERWVDAYPEQLRPKYRLGNYRGIHGWWLNKDLDLLHAQWGAEVAAYKITKYIQPEVVTIYTTPDYVNSLLIENKLKKDNNGNTEILERFWNQNVTWEHNELVHPILIYADLLATGDPRNIETAKMIYNDHVLRFIREN
jgi:hypothetical protein